MREMLRPRLPGYIPEFHYFDHPSEVETFLTDQGGPVTQWIVKPHTSQGSKGVSRLAEGASAEQIWSAYRESNFAGLLVERFIEGREYSVEAFVERGAIHNLAVTCKEHYPENDCIDRRNFYLGDVDAAVERSLYDANTKVISAMGLKQGPTHAEYMVGRDGTVYLMEIAARGGGGNISEKLIPYLTGFSPTEGILNFALGRPRRAAVLRAERGAGVSRDAHLGPGRPRPLFPARLERLQQLRQGLQRARPDRRTGVARAARVPGPARGAETRASVRVPGKPPRRRRRA
jgi:biotin carboxylase